ncbi:replication protein RepA [Rhodoferax sp. GW822-FHT02A01]|uniref:replication protein RepA n=1 Tax=Rhodoferax sp. GW822-FHT02A01 TaxID=3141537 RepID=UPI00315DE086
MTYGTSVSMESEIVQGEATQATLRERKLMDASQQIAGQRPNGDDLAFMHTIMCQVGLPRSKVDGLQFERKSGNSALLVEAGKLWDGKQFIQQPIPYGTMPRLMMAWMNTYAVRHKTPEIPVGDSASDFLRMLGKQTNGGQRGTFTTFRKQVQAFSACRMTLGFNADGKAHTYDGKPIKHFEAWPHNTGEQRSLWPASVSFSEEYFKTLIEHAVPLDIRALHALKGSALALDVYAWLSERLHRISRKSLVLHWVSLRDQFAQEYQGKNADKDFKTAFLIALRAVMAVYPQAKVKQVTGGLLLLPSPPPIPYQL